MFQDELKTILQEINKCELARTLGIHRDTVAKWLSGKQEPKVPQLVKLCRYLWSDDWETPYIRWSILLEQQKHLQQHQD